MTSRDWVLTAIMTAATLVVVGRFWQDLHVKNPRYPGRHHPQPADGVAVVTVPDSELAEPEAPWSALEDLTVPLIAGHDCWRTFGIPAHLADYIAAQTPMDDDDDQETATGRGAVRAPRPPAVEDPTEGGRHPG